MTVPTNTVQTFAMVGIREDLSDVISNIAPTETPMYSMARKGKCKNRSPEWQTDSLTPADADNYAVEGDDVTADSITATVRLKNYVQLFEKGVSVSSTAQAVDTAGREDELKYQVALRGKELKRDIEARICGNYASVAGNASTAGQCGGFESWITSNESRGTNGADGGFNTGTGLTVAATNGDQRAFTETLLKEVVREAWTNGGEPSVIMVGPFNKQVFSTFEGIATQYRDNPQKKMAAVIGAADVYVSDFGEFKVVPNRFSRDRSALVISPDTLSVLFLQPMKTEPLAKTGHADKRLLSCELTLKMTNEKANGCVADLSTS